eukprot:CAMPEP_0202480476 /NCGR_PEP_ID=MMETSP1361-20130828/452_1 /ASSEMBLY_ACC=CAM_ASM_000849 /TAXON_ID=210615 /ORGANISM="Staurosira complex sp., Strain CCMP2646" /LENGTH=312 /DNA_ID=CAMNT_0049107915 /DNA_START=49 /DNA_END=987 /DNA_ORIENTATION=+
MLLVKSLGCLVLLSPSFTAASFAPSSPWIQLHVDGRAPFLIRGGSDKQPPPSAPSLDNTQQQSSPQAQQSSPVSLGASNDDSSSAGEQTPTPPEATPSADLEANVVAQANDHMGPNAAAPGILRKAFPHVAWHRLPNILTYMRCIAIPLLVWLFYRPSSTVETSVLFGFASFTDWLDGYLARRWDITSPFGAFLDPVADKLMVSTSLILLTGKYGRIIAIPTAIILAREIAVSALREWMAQRGLRDSVKVGFQGKVKTAATMMSLTLLLLATSDASKLFLPSVAMLYLCALVTVTSGSVYFKAAAPVLMEGT